MVALGVASDSSPSTCFAVGVCGGGLLGVASGDGDPKDCLSGEGAGFGFGFGVGVGLGTISICWRLFWKSSRSRFSSSDCCETPSVAPRLNQIVSETRGILSLRRLGGTLGQSRTSNLYSFNLARRARSNVKCSVAVAGTAACSLQIHWKVSFLSFNLEVLVSKQIQTR